MVLQSPIYANRTAWVPGDDAGGEAHLRLRLQPSSAIRTQAGNIEVDVRQRDQGGKTLAGTGERSPCTAAIGIFYSLLGGHL